MQCSRGVIHVDVQAYSGVFRHDRNINKYIQLAQRKAYQCVGRILQCQDGQLVGAGSCVLIGGKYILTARHMFFEDVEKETTFIDQGHTIQTYIEVGERRVHTDSLRVEYGSNTYTMTKVWMYGEGTDSLEQDADLALVELDRTVVNVTPATLNAHRDELHATVTLVGNGVSGPANQPELISRTGRSLQV